ncbi:hypothetical protein P3W85_02465 [Cupriavidus basilensis]|uniref:Uncharacterized protein n=1 Tax=Cupriavidus basilensis TaxID=68895 RepID=A0ABT6AGV8_9BURK|nr:hypothetical protein [Cupriavidus basilensis]MDF3831824.1 hypothetical protein [Cupriavidus basilensis]
MGAVVFVVQEVDSGMFLCPYSGDVGFTHRLKEAGTFESREEAFETASDHCDEAFDVVAVFNERG